MKKKTCILTFIFILTFMFFTNNVKAQTCTGCTAGWDINAKNDDVEAHSIVIQDNGSHKYVWNGQTGATFKVGENFQLNLKQGDYGMPPLVVEINGQMYQNPDYKIWFDGQIESFKEAIANGNQLTGFSAVLNDALKANGFAKPEDYIKTLELEGSALQFDLYPGAVINGKLMTELDANSPEYKACMKENFGCAAVKIAQKSCGKGYITQNVCSADDTGMIECPPNTDNNGPTPPAIQPGGCDTPAPSIPNVPANNNVPADVAPKSSCGGMYISVDYSVVSSSCPYITLLSQTTTTASLPGMGGTVLAGKDFNFSNAVTVKSTTSKTIFDKSGLQNEVNTTTATIQKNGSDIECINQEIAKLTAEKANYISTEKAKCKCNKNPKDEGYSECVASANNCRHNVDEMAKAYDTAIENLRIEAAIKAADMASAMAHLSELQGCEANAQNDVGTTSSSWTEKVTAIMSIDQYKQTMNTIKGVSKGNGDLLTQDQIDKLDSYSYIKTNANFIVPVSTKNGSKGEVAVNVGSLTDYSCPFNVVNLIKCEDGDCVTPDPNIEKCTNPPCLDNSIPINSGGMNIIYRPISLTDPFPNIKNSKSYRKMGINWNDRLADTVIKNNRGVKDYDVYNQIPIYTITLTPAKIKEIREYNKKVSYNNFDMNCSNGYLCSSNFLWGTTENGYNFSDIVNQSESCATENNWNNCYGGGN